MKAAETFQKIDDVVLTVIKWVTIVIFIALTLLLSANVIFRQFANLAQSLNTIKSPLVRFVPVISITWIEEIQDMVFGALVFYGAAGVWVLKGHFSAGDWIGKRLKNPRAHAAYRLLVDIIAFVFIAIFFYYSLNLTMRALELTSVLNISRKVAYVCMPISGAIMTLYSLKFVVQGVLHVIKPRKTEEKPA
jgi:TRAP-type C4-dicarboxylate transport system permease small subunit